MRIYNTLHRQQEEIVPAQDKNVTTYTCGPTVYDYMHIGNLRTFVFSDVLIRALRYNGYQVKSAQNVTDIDDKIIKRANEQKKTIKEISDKYTKFFLTDINKLNVEPPTVRPFATEYIARMVDYIKALLDKGYAYKEKDGSVYFDISKFRDYGKLSGVKKRELKTGTRTLSDEYTKSDVQDFALWKSVPEKAPGSFQTDLGWGRPGWHIECSVMSQSVLGDEIDIHTGGVDLIFPHHENEIAQSEAKTGRKPFVKYWVHGAHMLVEGEKMSKSLNNFYTLSDIEKKGFDPLALRYLFLQTHYRQEMNFTWEALEAAQNALNKLRREISGFDNPRIGCAELENDFQTAVNDDLNMPQALAVVWQVVNSDNPTSAKSESIFKFDEILGLSLKDSGKILKFREKEMPDDIKKLLIKRDILRKEKNYAEADKIREKVIKMGYRVEDN